MIKRFRW